MIGPLLPYSVAAELLPGLRDGALEVSGALIKDTATGQIVAHVQEAGALQRALASGISGSANLLNPSGPVTGLAGLIQDQRIIGRLDAMQQALNGIQMLQLVGLATSVVGVGATVASTALMLRRLDQVDGAVGRVEAAIDDLPRRWTEGHMRDRIRRLRTTLARVDEAGSRRDADAIMASSEKDLHHDFDALNQGTADLLHDPRPNAELLAGLLASMSVCSSAQIKILIWLDEKEAALRRATDQFAKLRQLAWDAPPDVLRQRLQDVAAADTLSSRLGEARHAVASTPALLRTLIAREIDGRAYLEQAEAEDREPFLLLPADAGATEVPA